MGTDHESRLDGLRPEEKFAAVLVERATSAGAMAHDIPGAQGAYDVHLTYPDGREAALEVTTRSGPGVRHLEALLRADGWSWPNPGRWPWTASVGDVRDVKRFKASYAHIITLCESFGVADPEWLPYPLRQNDAHVRWLTEESSCQLDGHPGMTLTEDAGPPPGVWVVPDGRGAAVDTRLTGLPEAVSDLFAVDQVVARRAAKVGAVDTDERHLFILFGDGGLPDGVYIAMVGNMPEALPEEAPVIPSELTHLWLATRWSGSPLIGWSREFGWTAESLTD